MRYNLLLLMAICYLMLGGTPAREAFTAKKLAKDYVFIPTDYIGDTVIPEYYISALEVTNKQYRDFINDLIDSGATEKLSIAIVDSSQWASIVPSSKPFGNFYFQNKAYDDYPVVNVSKRGAELYCEWLTEKYNSMSKQKARFSLPTEKQWTYAAMGGNPKAIYPWPGNSLTYEKKGKMHGSRMCNYFVGASTNDSLHNVVDITSPSRSFMPNTFDIYNMGGNVAEMISDQNYTKGGSYLSSADYLLISAHEDADLSHGWPTIGFRPVMVFEKGP
jgi:formylglycine-generating enzyme required for sulfatase activity